MELWLCTRRLPHTPPTKPDTHSIQDQPFITATNMSAADKSHQGTTAPGYTEAEQNIDNTTEDISHKAQGHKANISNPSETAMYSAALLLISC
jgi:hypothetical protein